MEQTHGFFLYKYRSNNTVTAAEKNEAVGGIRTMAFAEVIESEIQRRSFIILDGKNGIFPKNRWIEISKSTHIIADAKYRSMQKIEWFITETDINSSALFIDGGSEKRYHETEIQKKEESC